MVQIKNSHLTRIQIALFTIFITVSLIAGYGYVVITDTVGMALLRPVGELDDSFFRTNLTSHSLSGFSNNQQKFLELLEHYGFKPGHLRTIQDIAQLQTWIGNLVEKAEPYWGPERGYQLLKTGMNGKGLSCGSLSYILKDALSLLCIPSRTIQLYKSDFSEDTHVVVEAFVSGKWIVFDPTFNVTYENETGPLGIAQIQDRLSDKGPTSVQPVFHGSRRYPASLDNYYMDWRPLFSNAYVFDISESHGLISKLPPFRYWKGPQKYVFGDKTVLFAKAHNKYYFLFCVVLPLIAVGNFILCIVLFIWSKRNRKCAA